jgi:DNA repair protein RadD
MIQLRPYQRAAVDATYAYWGREGGSPLIELATGTGKSVVIATLIRELMANYPHLRILSLVHVRELVEQNALELLGLWPGAPVGINSAGLRRRDTAHPIIFASIQSVHRAAQSLGRRDLILLDEAHLLPKHGEGMYHELIKEMSFTTSPDLRLWGCTATPFRLDSGRLDQGDGRLFDRIVYSYGVGDGIRDGFLVPLVSKAGATQIDVSGVARRGGEFVAGALEAVADRDEVTRAAVKEIVAAGAGRRSWLIFASSVRHAHHVREAVRSHGVTCEVISAETPDEERRALLAAFKAGSIRCLANMSVLTTGFNAPRVDLIAMLRPTLSTGLYVQMLGRGTRCVGADYEASVRAGKADCLVLDFSGNVRRHGPVDDLSITAPGRPTGRAIERVDVADVAAEPCPNCLSYNSVRARLCMSCGEELKAEAKHEAVADTTPILSGIVADDWRPVASVTVSRHVKMGAPDAPATLRVTYQCGRKKFSDFLCFDHPAGSYPRRKAESWWREKTTAPIPASVDDALGAVAWTSDVEAIKVRNDGQYDRVVAHQMKRTLLSGVA